MIARLTLVFALLALPAQAGTLVNSEAVAACFHNTDDPASCTPTVLAPCKHLVRAGLQRSCFARLRHRWERLISEATSHLPNGYALPHAQIRARCDTITRAQNSLGFHDHRIARNACRLTQTARWWFEMTLPAD